MSFLVLPASVVWAGVVLLAGALYLLQRLRVRHREVVVPTTLFWRAAVQETRARVFRQRFRHPLAYLLLLLIAALIWLAVAEPAPAAENDRVAVTLLLDGSAGMAWGDRFARAKKTLLEQVKRVPEREAEVIFCGGWPRTLLRRGEHSILLERRLERVSPEACPASLERVVAALPRDRKTTLVVVGDGPLRDAALPAGFTVLRPGRSGAVPENRGVLALGVSEAASGAWDRVDVHVEAPAGTTVSLETLVDVPARGQEVVVRLPGSDAIALDDEARLILPRRSTLRVRPTPELRAVLAADPGVVWDDEGVAIEIVDGGGITIEGPPDALATAPEDPLEFVDVERGTAAPTCERRPGSTRRVRLGRDLLSDRTNFTRGRSFPLFVAAALRWLARTEGFPAYVAAGEPVPGGDFIPPVAGTYAVGEASLLDPLARTTAPRDDGLERAGGAGDLAGWLALLAFALLMAEWYLLRTGRLP